MPDHPGVAFGPEGLIYRNQTDAKSKPPSRGSA
jgi:hypothetical protein